MTEILLRGVCVNLDTGDKEIWYLQGFKIHLECNNVVVCHLLTRELSPEVMVT